MLKWGTKQKWQNRFSFRDTQVAIAAESVNVYQLFYFLVAIRQKKSRFNQSEPKNQLKKTHLHTQPHLSKRITMYIH